MTSYSPMFAVLANGEWVRHGMVWRWEPAADPVPEVEPERSPRDLIACPRCMARMDERCKTCDGRDHAARLVKRVCSCGGPIRPREPICGWCRVERESA